MKNNSFWKKLKEYFSIYLPKQRNSSEKTIATCRMAWNLFLRFLMREKELKPADIRFETFNSGLLSEFLDTMERNKGWEISTRNNRLSCIRAFFKFATYTCAEAYVVYSDLCTVPLKREIDNTRVINHMPKDAITAILECINTETPKGVRDCFFLTLMYDTAARNGEMLKLKLFDINIENATVCLFGKGSKPRLVPVSKETLSLFSKYKLLFHKDSSTDALLFYTKHRNGKTSMSDDNVARFIKKYATQAHEKNPAVPLAVHPHMFRHSRAMHLYQGGMPLAMLSEFLGHEDPETTLIYAYADTEMKREAVNKATDFSFVPNINSSDSPIWDNTDIINQLLRGY